MKGIIYLPANNLAVLAELSKNEYPEVEDVHVQGVKNEKGEEFSHVAIIDEDYEKVAFCAKYLMKMYGLEKAALELHDCDEVGAVKPVSLVVLKLAKDAEITIPEGIKYYISFTTFWPFVAFREEPGGTLQEQADWLDLVTDLSDLKEVEEVNSYTVRVVEL